MNKEIVIKNIETNPELTEIIKNNASKIDKFYSEKLFHHFFNSINLLQTIATKESDYGHNNVPRYEPAYGPGGIYFKANHVKNLYEKYGKDACCSYSSFQIMFITAFELGYRESPKALANDSIAIHWAIKYIQNRILKFNPLNLEQIFDAYNSGNFKDKNIPKEYISDCLGYYVIIKEYNETLIKTIKEQIDIYTMNEIELDFMIKEIQDTIKKLNQIEIMLLKKKG